MNLNDTKKMRQLKFRAWDKIDQKWLFGYDYPRLGGFNLIGEVVLFGELNSIPLERWNDIHIMQYTGLKDKNGVEIYEGDFVIRTVYTSKKKLVDTGEVRYHNDSASFTFYSHCYLTLICDNIDLEVIGNIYQPIIKQI